jgi:sulfur carrier protein ThiS
MMRVRVRLYGTLRRFSAEDSPGETTVEVRPGTTVAEVIRSVGAPMREVYVAAVDGAAVPVSFVLERDCELVLVTPAGAG